jgi:hypothetical protein
MQLRLDFLPDEVQRDPLLYALLAAFVTLGALLGIWFLLALIAIVRFAVTAMGS